MSIPVVGTMLLIVAAAISHSVATIIAADRTMDSATWDPSSEPRTTPGVTSTSRAEHDDPDGTSFRLLHYGSLFG